MKRSKKKIYLPHHVSFLSVFKASVTNKFFLNRYRRKRPKLDASIFDLALSYTESLSRSDASEKKEKKIACPFLDIFACGQVSSPRLYG